MKGKAWTREDIIVAYALYCVTPMSTINMRNKTILEVAALSARSPSSLVMRMLNFRAIDPKALGKINHAAKLDRIIFEEFQHDWGALSLQAEEITGLDLFDSDPLNGAKPLSSLTNKNKVSRERQFFRKAVLSAYEYRCCISGQTLPAMLVASHIKPFQKCRSSGDRTSPENGLCLNVFYDKAFDQGYITIDPSLTIRVSPKVQDFPDAFSEQWLIALEGESISLPQRFRPQKEFLEYHNDVIFRA